MPLTNYPGVSIVVLNWNGQALLQECLPSVVAAAQAYPGPCEVVVSDNGSTDGSLALLRDHFPTVRVLSLERNFGFQIGCNRGIDASQHEIVVLLNNDVAVEPDFVAPLVAVLAGSPEAFAAAPKMYYWDRQHVFCSTISGEFRWGRFFQKWALNRQLQDICAQRAPSLYVSGGAMAFDKARFNQLGQFDSLYAPIYWEDTDLSYRAWKNGWTLWYEPASVVYHKVSATMKHNRLSQHLNMQRNSYLFVWRNFTDAALVAQHVLLLPLNILASSFKAARTHQVAWPRALWVEVQAIITALRKLPEVRRRRRADRQFRKLTDREVLRRSDWRNGAPRAEAEAFRF